MLCSETFGKRRLIFKHNCKRCGKAVCDACSKQKRRLCQNDTKRYRVCDECDTLMENHMLDGMFERESQTKKQDFEELRRTQGEADMMRDECQHLLNQAKI